MYLTVGVSLSPIQSWEREVILSPLHRLVSQSETHLLAGFFPPRLCHLSHQGQRPQEHGTDSFATCSGKGKVVNSMTSK